MDRDEAIKRAEVAMAWARGETVQWKGILQSSAHWRHEMPTQEFDDCAPPFWDENLDWRIKPKRRECWVLFNQNNGSAADVRATQPCCKDHGDGYAWVLMREVEGEE